jgi:hypothetical protein
MPLTQTQIIQGPVTPGGLPLTVAGSDLTTKLAKANLALYAANGKVGTGSPQSFSHGLGAVPSFVTVMFTGSTAAQAVTYGTHTSTNVVLTVTTGATFDVIALA